MVTVFLSFIFQLAFSDVLIIIVYLSVIRNIPSYSLLENQVIKISILQDKIYIKVSEKSIRIYSVLYL